MSAPATTDELVDLVRRSGLVEAAQLDEFLRRSEIAELPRDLPRKLARRLVRAGLLTSFQGEQFLLGKWRGFGLGKYRLLERLGADELGNRFLGEDAESGERVALQLLPDSAAEGPASVARFYREARIAAGLDHPHVIGRHDIQRDGRLHFVVTPHVDGSTLQRIIRKHGPLDVTRAAHYVRQAARGLQHIHEAGLVHRDLRPENLLLDRQGTIKIANLGLTRFYHDQREAAGKKRDHPGPAAGYLAPEQAVAGGGVDIRTDIHGLGAVFYYLLTGRPPAGEAGSRDLLACVLAEPEPVRTLRPEVPEELAVVVAKMLARDPAQRYQTPAEVVEALEPWTQMPIAPPPAEEMPHLGLAVPNTAVPVVEELTPLPEPVPELPKRPADPIERWAASVPTQEEEAVLANLPEPPPPGEVEAADSPAASSEAEITLDEGLGEEDAPPELSASLEPEAQAAAVEEEPAARVALAEPPASPDKANGRHSLQRSATLAVPPRLQKRAGAAAKPPPVQRPSAAPAPKRRLWFLVLASAVVLPGGVGLGLLAQGWLREPPLPPAAVETPAEKKERQLEGAVEAVNADVIHGWAWDRAQPGNPISVDVYDGPTRVATVSADIYRQDLHTRGIGNGRHVFGWKLPASLRDGKEHLIQVKFAGTDTELSGSPRKIMLKVP